VNRTRLGRIIRARLLEHFELFLTTVGVVIAILLTFAELTRGERGVAFVSLIWLQGLCRGGPPHAWLRQRALMPRWWPRCRPGQQTAHRHARVAKGEAAAVRREQEDLETASVAPRSVSYELENLSPESVRQWSGMAGDCAHDLPIVARPGVLCGGDAPSPPLVLQDPVARPPSSQFT
jgi:hypothetical protein